MLRTNILHKNNYEISAVNRDTTVRTQMIGIIRKCIHPKENNGRTFLNIPTISFAVCCLRTTNYQIIISIFNVNNSERCGRNSLEQTFLKQRRRRNLRRELLDAVARRRRNGFLGRFGSGAGGSLGGGTRAHVIDL